MRNNTQRLKKEEHYCLKRRNDFFVYNFQPKFFRKKHFKAVKQKKAGFLKRSKYTYISLKKAPKAAIFYH